MPTLPLALNVFTETGSDANNRLWQSGRGLDGTWKTQKLLYGGEFISENFQRFCAGAITPELQDHLGGVIDGILVDQVLFIGNGFTRESVSPSFVDPTPAWSSVSGLETTATAFSRTGGAFWFNDAFWMFLRCVGTTTGPFGTHAYEKVICLKSTDEYITITEPDAANEPVVTVADGTHDLPGSFQDVRWDGVSNLVYVFVQGPGITPNYGTVDIYAFDMNTETWSLIKSQSFGAQLSVPNGADQFISPNPVPGTVVHYANGDIAIIYMYQSGTGMWYRLLSSGTWGSEIKLRDAPAAYANLIIDPSGEKLHVFTYVDGYIQNGNIFDGGIAGHVDYMTVLHNGTASSVLFAFPLPTGAGDLLYSDGVGLGTAYVEGNLLLIPYDDSADPSNAVWEGSISSFSAFTKKILPVPPIEDSSGNFVSCAEVYYGFVPDTPTLACPIPSEDSGVVGFPFSAQLLATGGTPPTTFNLISGTLPPGTSLDSATGIISGTPTVPGVFPYVASLGQEPPPVATVQVSGVPPAYRQSKSEINPFQIRDGDNLYQVLTTIDGTLMLNIFKSTDGGLSWAVQDSANVPDQGNQQGTVRVLWDSGTQTLTVGYVVGNFVSFKVAEFDTATDTWGAASAGLTLSADASVEERAILYRKSSGDYVLVSFNTTLHLWYAVLSAGTWSGKTSLTADNNFASVGVGAVDANDILHFIGQQGFALRYRQLSASFVLGSTITFSPNFSGKAASPFYLYNSNRPTVQLYGADSIAFAYPSSAGTIVVQVGTPLSAPVFTRYTIYTAINYPPNDEVVWYPTLELGLGGDLNIFFMVFANTFIENKILQSVFDGISSWSTPTPYYDEIATPPGNVNPVMPAGQFMAGLDVTQRSDGQWIAATVIPTFYAVVGSSTITGFALIPLTTGCEITITAGAECPEIYVARQPQPEAPPAPPPPGIPR